MDDLVTMDTSETPGVRTDQDVAADAPQPVRLRNPDGTFPRGVSGNPAGAPRAKRDLRDLCRANSPQAIDRLIKIIATGKDRDATHAAEVILAYGYGKPTTHIAGDDDADPIKIAQANPLAELLVTMIDRERVATKPEPGPGST